MIKARTIEDIEEEVMLRDTWEVFNVDETSGGLDADLLRLLMQHVRTPPILHAFLMLRNHATDTHAITFVHSWTSR